MDTPRTEIKQLEIILNELAIIRREQDGQYDEEDDTGAQEVDFSGAGMVKGPDGFWYKP
jgi:hypothetical protein